MIYGEDVSHVVSEEGIAYLYKAQGGRGAARGARGHRRRHPGRPARRRRSAPRRCARAASSPTRRIWACGARRRSARCSPRAASTTSSPGPEGCTVPRRVSAAGRIRCYQQRRTADLHRGCAAMRGCACAGLADRAVRALIAEAMLTPKPALVDQRGPGAHRDLDLARLLRSAEALRGSFCSMALQASAAPPALELRERLGALGRAGRAAHAGRDRRQQCASRRDLGARSVDRGAWLRGARRAALAELGARRGAAGASSRPPRTRGCRATARACAGASA